MKAKHGIILLIASQGFTILAKILNSFGTNGSGWMWDLSSVCWTLGWLIVLYKVLNSEKLKAFLEE